MNIVNCITNYFSKIKNLVLDKPIKNQNLEKDEYLVWDEPINDEDLDKRVNEYGTIRYYKKGTNVVHRTNGPAFEYADGNKCWYYKGKLIENCSSQEEFEKFLRLQNLKAFW